MRTALCVVSVRGVVLCCWFCRANCTKMPPPPARARRPGRDLLSETATAVHERSRRTQSGLEAAHVSHASWRYSQS
jgi:hypothetical protein